MSFPSIHDIVQSDLFTSEAEIRDKFPQTAVERRRSSRSMYNWLISNPETKDREFFDETLCHYHVIKSVAYDDLQVLKKVLHITHASRNYHRWKYNEMMLETYQAAKSKTEFQNKDVWARV